MSEFSHRPMHLSSTELAEQYIPMSIESITSLSDMLSPRRSVRIRSASTIWLRVPFASRSSGLCNMADNGNFSREEKGQDTGRRHRLHIGRVPPLFNPRIEQPTRRSYIAYTPAMHPTARSHIRLLFAIRGFFSSPHDPFSIIQQYILASYYRAADNVSQRLDICDLPLVVL